MRQRKAHTNTHIYIHQHIYTPIYLYVCTLNIHLYIFTYVHIGCIPVFVLGNARFSGTFLWSGRIHIQIHIYIYTSIHIFYTYTYFDKCMFNTCNTCIHIYINTHILYVYIFLFNTCIHIYINTHMLYVYIFLHSLFVLARFGSPGTIFTSKRIHIYKYIYINIHTGIYFRMYIPFSGLARFGSSGTLSWSRGISLTKPARYFFFFTPGADRTIRAGRSTILSKSPVYMCSKIRYRSIEQVLSMHANHIKTCWPIFSLKFALVFVFGN